ncbi:hypothetical protein ACMHYK_15505 [Candidatus Enterenecus avicola]
MKRKIKIILGAITVFFVIYLISGFTYIHLKNEAISQNISAVAQQDIKTATTTSVAEPEQKEVTATKESISDSSVVEESAEKVEESKENTSEVAEQEQEKVTATGIINKADIKSIKEEIIEKNYKMDYNTTNDILGYVVVPEVDLALPITEGINKEVDMEWQQFF